MGPSTGSNPHQSESPIGSPRWHRQKGEVPHLDIRDI
jgi:hypothetical protein